VPFALPALADLSLQLMGRTTELDWHGYPLMVLAVIATMFTCFRAMAFVQRRPAVLLAVYGLIVAAMVAPVLVKGLRSYTNLYEISARVPALLNPTAVGEFGPFIPPGARLCVTSDLLPFFADRRYLLWPESIAYAEYVLVNRRDSAENAKVAEEFRRSLPFGDPASAHFYSEMDYVLRGYANDASLLAYLDRQIGENNVTVLRTDGRLTLFRVEERGRISPPKWK